MGVRLKTEPFNGASKSPRNGCITSSFDNPVVGQTHCGGKDDDNVANGKKGLHEPAAPSRYLRIRDKPQIYNLKMLSDNTPYKEMRDGRKRKGTKTQDSTEVTHVLPDNQRVQLQKWTGIRCFVVFRYGGDVAQKPVRAVGVARPDGAGLGSKTGIERQLLKGHIRYVTLVAFWHDSRSVISASYEKTVRIWDAKTGEQRQVLQTGYVDKLHFDLDRTQLLRSRGTFAIARLDENISVRGHENILHAHITQDVPESANKNMLAMA
ncbi:hypothetical protein TruAng_005622 [Truncatella angustata]|nr:hypothetical protein TruAng_005622 [Truncatella angustata]